MNAFKEGDRQRRECFLGGGKASLAGVCTALHGVCAKGISHPFGHQGNRLDGLRNAKANDDSLPCTNRTVWEKLRNEN